MARFSFHGSLLVPWLASRSMARFSFHGSRRGTHCQEVPASRTTAFSNEAKREAEPRLQWVPRQEPGNQLSS